MKKTVKLLCMMMLFITTISLSSCVLTQETSIKFVKFPESTYFVNTSEDEIKNKVTVEIENKVLTLAEAESEYSAIVSGIELDEIGDHTLVVVYQSLVISYQYQVINTINTITPDSEWVGEGTETSPYLISSINEMFGLAEKVNDSKDPEHYGDKYFKLIHDLDFQGVVWKPIGEGTREGSSNYFSGNFDGDGHKIKNLSDLGYVPTMYNNYYSHAGHYIENGYVFGLFGLVKTETMTKYIDENTTETYYPTSTFKNVIFENIQIYGAQSIKSETNEYINFSGDGVGSLIGCVLDSDHISISILDCEVLNGTVESHDNVGGLVGRITSKTAILMNCKNSANVKSTIFANGRAGGILGYIQFGPQYFQNCSNTGNISVMQGTSCGGIVGMITSGTEQILWYYNCTNTGNCSINNELFHCNSFNDIYETSKVFLDENGSLNAYGETLEKTSSEYNNNHK